MRIRDIIVETKIDLDSNNDGLPDSHQSATPGLRSHYKLDNSSPYHPWRFAALFLGGAGDKSGAYEHEPAKDGPSGQSLITAAYSEGEQAILDQASKAFGPEAAFRQLTPNGSTEIESVNKTSPTRQVGAIQRKSK
jgi:hypothetical protein